jgi:hypothetical protein
MEIWACALASVGMDIVGTDRPIASASDRNNDDLDKASSLWITGSEHAVLVCLQNYTTLGIGAIGARQYDAVSAARSANQRDIEDRQGRLQTRGSPPESGRTEG